MKAHFAPGLLATALLFNACGDGRSDAAKQMAAAADSARTATSVDLAAHDLPLTLEMPSGTPRPTILWKEETGKLEVQAGDHFDIEIVEGTADRGRLKADLERDLLKKNTIVEETPELLIYRSEFPDDTTLVFFHFDRTITVGDRSFEVTDAGDGKTFTLSDIRGMDATVHTKTPA